MSAFFADEEEVALNPTSLPRTTSIPTSANTTMLDFGDPLRRSMPSSSNEAAISGYMAAEQPKYRSMSLGQPAPMLSAPTMVPVEPASGFINMRSFVPPLPIPRGPLKMQADVFEKNDSKVSSWATTGVSSEETGAVNAPGFSDAPTLPHFLSYEDDHFPYLGDIEHFRSVFLKLTNELGFDAELKLQSWEYVLESYPGDDHVIIQVRIYRDAACGHMIDFRRLQGGNLYRGELEKIWNFFREQGCCEKLVQTSNNMFVGSLPEFEASDDGYQVKKETIQPVFKMMNSTLLDVRLTGAQLVATSFKNKATLNALVECDAASKIISALRGSNDDELDRCLTAGLRNAVDDFHESIFDHIDGVKILILKLQTCMNSIFSVKIEVGRNCARALTMLAAKDEKYKTWIRENDGFQVASKIANGCSNNVHLIALAQTLCTSLQ